MRVREALVSLQLHGITGGVFGGKTRESLQSYTCLGAMAEDKFFTSRVPFYFEGDFIKLVRDKYFIVHFV